MPILTPPDRDLCRQLLPQVSRTFALSIEMLPDALQESVRVAYLLCRLVDTVEDDPQLRWPVRVRMFQCFDQLLLDDRLPPEVFAALAQRHDLGTGAEAQLADESGAVFRSWRALPDAQRQAIRGPVLEMSVGMRAYCARANEEGHLRITDLGDLDQYCYFVAGTVGKLLTRLFLNHIGPVEPERQQGLHDRAVAFGQGLQMVNILKDVAEDARRGVTYLPESVIRRHGVAADQILDPSHRDDALRAVREVTARARAHLRSAVAYTLMWPADAIDVRLFCAVPLMLAGASLQVIEDGPDTLRPGRTPKTGREAVLRAVDDARRTAGDDQALAEVLDRWTQ